MRLLCEGGGDGSATAAQASERASRRRRRRMKEREDKNDPGRRASRVPPGMCKFRGAESYYSALAGPE